MPYPTRLENDVFDPLHVELAGTSIQPVREDSNSLQAGTSVLTPLFAPIAAAAMGDNEIVAAVPLRRIRVIRYDFVCSAAVTVQWQSSVAGAISGSMSFAANGGIATPEALKGIMQTAVGEALQLNLSAGVPVGGSITYVEV